MAKPPTKKVTAQQARQILEKQRQRIRERYKDDTESMNTALRLFEADPAIQQARKVAGLAPVTTSRLEIENEARARRGLAPKRRPATRQEKIRETARRTIEQQKKENKDSFIPEFVRDKGAGALAGVNDAFFGLPARASAALLGIDNDLMQEYIDQQGGRAPVTRVVTGIAASVPTGGAIIKGGGAAATRLAASGARPVAATGRALERTGKALTLKRGENLKNVGRLATVGAGFGAATEAGKGRDILPGAAYGAGGAVTLGAGFKAGGWLASKAGEALRLSGASTILRNYTKTTKEELQRRLTEFRQKGQSEPTLYELLDLEDRQALQQVFARTTPRQQARGADMARARVESIPRDVANVARKATEPQRQANEDNLRAALASSRDDIAPTPDEARLAAGATENPTNLAQIRRDEARNIMGPFDKRTAAKGVDDLIPTELRQGKKPGEIEEVPIDPEMAQMIRSVAGLARIRPKEEGITVREVTGMLSDLRQIASGKGSPIERGAAQRAIDHIEDKLAAEMPDMAVALTRMKGAWAARSRQLEGMQETRLQSDVNPNTARNLARSENVYQTPEGSVGRAMAQRTELLDDLGRRPDVALGTARNLAGDETLGRQLAQNLGRPATDEITQAATTQVESARRLATAVRDPKYDAAELESGDLAVLAASLNPASMAYTKARAVTILFERLAKAIPESRSRVIVDMLFSRDPAMTQRAINALRSEGRTGTEALRDIAATMGGAVLGTTANDPAPPNAPMPAAVEEPVQGDIPEGDTDLSQLSDEELLQMYQDSLQAPEAGEGGEDGYLQDLSDEELLLMYQDIGAEMGNQAPFKNDGWYENSGRMQ